MTSEQYRYLVGLTAGGGSPSAGSYRNFINRFLPAVTGEPLRPGQLSPNPPYSHASTDPNVFLDDPLFPLPRAAPAGTGRVPPGGDKRAWAGTTNNATNQANVDWGNQLVRDYYQTVDDDLVTRMTQRGIREGDLGPAAAARARMPSGQLGDDEPWQEPQNINDPLGAGGPLPPHEAMDVPPGVYPTPTPSDTPEPFEPPSMPLQTIYPDSTPAPNPATFPDVRMITGATPTPSPNPTGLPSPAAPGGAPNIVNTMSPYPGAPPTPVMPEGPGLPGPTPGELPSPPGEIPTYPNQVITPDAPNEIPTFGNQVIYPDQPDVPTPTAPQGFDYTGLNDNTPGTDFLYNPPVTGGEPQAPDFTGLPAAPAGEYLYNPPVTGAPAAPVTDAGISSGAPTGSYPYLYNPPVTGPTGQPLDFSGIPDAVSNATVTPVSLFGGDTGNTQASNFIPNPEGGYWGYDSNWNWVGSVDAPSETAGTEAVNPNLFTEGGDASGSGSTPPETAGEGEGTVPTDASAPRATLIDPDTGAETFGAEVPDLNIPTGAAGLNEGPQGGFLDAAGNFFDNLANNIGYQPPAGTTMGETGPLNEGVLASLNYPGGGSIPQGVFSGLGNPLNPPGGTAGPGDLGGGGPVNISALGGGRGMGIIDRNYLIKMMKGLYTSASDFGQMRAQSPSPFPNAPAWNFNDYHSGQVALHNILVNNPDWFNQVVHPTAGGRQGGSDISRGDVNTKASRHTPQTQSK